jgi:diguanylate cyclase (GGDEF)-like protein/PAS domain S-box-containing protein
MAARLNESMEELETGKKRFMDMAENTSDWLWETNAEDCYTFCSGRIENILGYAPQQMIGAGFFQFMVPADAKRLDILLNEARRDETAFYGFEYKAIRKDGAVIDLETNGVPIFDRKGKLTGFRGVTRDITRRKEDASRLVYLSEHDALTGLLSRHKFLEILDDEVEFSELTNTPTTLLYVDLDGFKLLNDTHGHIVGDALLKLVAELLINESGATAQIARLGGDEFGILLRGVESENGKKLAKRVLSSIDSAPLAINNSPIHITAGIGICTSPQDGLTGETLIAHADAALNHAKAMGHNRYYIYQGSDRDIDTMRDTVSWRSVIHSAMEEGRLYIEYQPIVSTAFDSQFEKYEALVRIRGKKGEAIAAGEFIRTAEHTGQISEIDKWVLKTVMRTITESPNSNLCIAVNVSGKSLETPGFCEYCQKLAFESAVKPQQLVFEITETTAIAEMTRAENFMTIMKRLGYRFSLDDFGVGFSSFSYLKHLPVDQIKIDGSFIRHLETSREDQIFVDAIVRVAKGLGLESVAEFVENSTTFEMLAKMGVDNVQGHYIGMADKAMKWPDIKRLTQSRPRRAEK